MSQLLVRLTPSVGADHIDGAGLTALIAKALAVAKSKVAVATGATTRLKALQIEGVSEAEVAALIARFGEASYGPLAPRRQAVGAKARPVRV